MQNLEENTMEETNNIKGTTNTQETNPAQTTDAEQESGSQNPDNSRSLNYKQFVDEYFGILQRKEDQKKQESEHKIGRAALIETLFRKYVEDDKLMQMLQKDAGTGSQKEISITLIPDTRLDEEYARLSNQKVNTFDFGTLVSELHSPFPDIIRRYEIALSGKGQIQLIEIHLSYNGALLSIDREVVDNYILQSATDACKAGPKEINFNTALFNDYNCFTDNCCVAFIAENDKFSGHYEDEATDECKRRILAHYLLDSKSQVGKLLQNATPESIEQNLCKGLQKIVEELKAQE